MREISDYLKRKLADFPGIDDVTSHLEGGKQIIRINGATAEVGVFASDNEIEAGIRLALNIPKEAAVAEPDQVPQADAAHVTDLPPAPVLAEPTAAPAAPVRKPAPGGFAASLKAIVNDARDGLARARADGLAEVQDAVGELHKARAAIAHVTGTMASNIRDEVADIQAELGQVSNDLGE